MLIDQNKYVCTHIMYFRTNTAQVMIMLIVNSNDMMIMTDVYMEWWPSVSIFILITCKIFDLGALVGLISRAFGINSGVILGLISYDPAIYSIGHRY